MTSSPRTVCSPRELPGALATAVWTGGRLDAVPQFVHNEFCLRNGRGDVVLRGREAFAASITSHHTLLADISLRVAQVLVDETELAWRWELTGHLRDPEALSPALQLLCAHVPELQTVRLTGMSMGRLEEGLLIEERCETDEDALARQAGWEPGGPDE